MKSSFWLSFPLFAYSSIDSLLVVMSYEQYITPFVAGLEKRPDGFLPFLFFHSSWTSFHWNPHAPLTLLQEVHHFFFLQLWIMVAVVRSLVSDSTCFLVTHSGSSFRTSWVCYHWNHFPLTCSISGYGPFYYTCDISHQTWKMTPFQSHYHFHCGSSWNQPDSKPFWLTAQ